MLTLPPIQLERPPDLAGVLATLRQQPDARILAGGTDLVLGWKQGLQPAEVAVSLGRAGLDGITRENDGWTIGAATTLWDLTRWEPGDPALAAVVEAAGLIAAPPLRSRATTGGNLCLDTRCIYYNQSAFWRSSRALCRKAGGEVCHAVPRGDRCHAVHQADLPPVLIALGATVDLATASDTRTLPLAELYSGEGTRPLTLEPGELLIRVCLPVPPPGAGAAYEKLRTRKGLDFPAVSAAVYLEGDAEGICQHARVVLGAVGTSPTPVPEAETALVGSRIDGAVLTESGAAATRSAHPVKNADLTPAYRRKVAGTLVERAARRAWARARDEEGGSR